MIQDIVPFELKRQKLSTDSSVSLVAPTISKDEHIQKYQLRMKVSKTLDDDFVYDRPVQLKKPLASPRKKTVKKTCHTQKI